MDKDSDLNLILKKSGKNVMAKNVTEKGRILDKEPSQAKREGKENKQL